MLHPGDFMKDTRTLNSLALDEEAIIIETPENSDLSRRLLDLGFIENTRVRCILVGPKRESAAYRIRGTTIALRKEDASQIVICRNRPRG
jgi:Fe2+ transport system protein FeoA